jgi:hypothetical protein
MAPCGPLLRAVGSSGYRVLWRSQAVQPASLTSDNQSGCGGLSAAAARASGRRNVVHCRYTPYTRWEIGAVGGGRASRVVKRRGMSNCPQ